MKEKTKQELLLEIQELRRRLQEAEKTIRALEKGKAEPPAPLGAEEALRASEARFRTIFEGAALGIAQLDLQGRFLETNPTFQKMLGYSAQELEGNSIAEITHPDDVKPYQALFDELAAGIWDHFHWENRYLPQDGSPLWGSLTASLVRGEGGEPQFAIAMVEDITAKKEAEQEIHRQASFPELNPNPVLEVDEESRVIYANPAAQKAAAGLGLTEGVRAFLPPDLKERFAGARQGGARYHSFDLALKDATYAVNLSFPQDLPTARLYALDITQRQAAEQALRESREDLNRAQAVAHTGSWRMNVQKNELTWSEENHRIFGIPEGTPLTYETFLATVHPEDREYVDRKWMAALRGESYDIEHRIVVGDTVKWVRERAELDFDPQGQLLGGFGTTQDITGRKRGEEALLRAKEEWETTFNAVPDLIAVLDENHRIKRANRAMAQVLGVTPEEMVGRPCYEAIHRMAEPPDYCPHSRAMRDCKEHQTELHELGRDFLVTATPLCDPQGRPIASVHVARDITARKRAEEALRKAHDELEQRVQERTAELRLTVEQLQWEMDERQQAEAAMEFERRRLFSLLEQIPAYVVLLAPDYIVPFANREFVRRFGEAEEGQKCYEFLFGRNEPCPDCQTFKVLETNQPQEWEWLGPDGRIYAVYDYPFTDADGSSLILEMGLDITDRKQAEETRNQLAEILEASPDFVGTAAADGRIQYINRAGREMLGLGAEEDLSLVTMEAAHPRWAGDLVMEEGLPAAHRDGVWQAETAFLGRGGRVIPISQMILAHKTADGAMKFFSTIARDITERKQAEAKINRINRLYAVLSRINEAIVRLRDPQLLYQEACRIAVEEGRFRLAWIGLVDPDNLSLMPVTHAGWEKGYLKNIKISLTDSPEGRGPTGTALREGRYNICNDIAEEAHMAPWREEALKRGYRSSAAFPLRSGTSIIGALSLYAGESQFFTAEEIQLLESLAGDLSFAMEAMEQEDRRRQAEKALRESEKKLRFLSTELLGAQEKERQRLSRELHDELGHALLILKLHLRTIEKQLLPEQLPLSQDVESLLRYIDEVIEKVRRLYQDLIPGDLEDLGLTVALKHMFDDFIKHHDLIEWSISLDDIDNLYPLPTQTNIYRIMQEILTNIGKHANPNQVSISIKRKNQKIHFAVADNGTGFDMKKVLALDAPAKGLGLVALEERVRMLGGSLKIRSREGAGTKITFTIPPAAGGN